MIRLKFDPPASDADWSDWVDKARDLVDRMLADEANRPPIDEDLYKRPRDRFLQATHGKCAYCEEKVMPGQRHGDVEHYRPKGAVRDQNGKVVTIERHGQTMKHPGYYWLAYDHTNLLPSCLACNRRGMDAASGTNTGKSDLFPTLDGKWAARPEDVANEQPALLNPWFDDPSEHLQFAVDTGRIVGITQRGRITVEVLGLNRAELPTARLEASEAAANAYALFVSDVARAHKSDERQIRDAVGGTAEYAAFRRAAINEARRLVREREDDVLTPGE